MRTYARLVGAVALFGLTACELGVTNFGSPDVARVLSDAGSVEAAISGLGSQLNNPQRASESVNTQAKILAEETFASVANFGMAARVANRTLVSNELGNDNQTGNLANFNSFQRVTRLTFNTLAAFNNLVAANRNTLSATAVNRMRAFAYLVAGQSLGMVSLAYDSASIADEAINTTDIPGLSGAADVNAKAIEYLDSAVVIAGRGMDALPNTWISGVALNQADFVRLARSYRARYRAGVARTPAERAALNWAAIIADATNGISADHNISINGQTGWGAGFDAGQIYVTGGWHSVPMKYVGMADSSGAYQAWVATPSASRRAFLVQTLDGRWPAGGTRAAPQALSTNTIIAPRYLRNRPTGDDVVIAGDGESFYDHRRYGLTQSNTSVAGPYTDMSKTEMDMLAAEGYIRTGQAALAEPLIDISRLRNGLPSVVGVGAGVVPGGAACVPKLPNGTCGTLLEAMKYEKRMETAFTGYMIWYTDSRGWGDLPTGTVIEWPVPYQEMQARLQPFYNGTRQSGASTYGF
ncbi:MAG: hypothetical protein IT357_11555 [Gemmatimonadaceae bacterium]|nr:hypothetical protein [Gemmatimonadaceae bacterium]